MQLCVAFSQMWECILCNTWVTIIVNIVFKCSVPSGCCHGDERVRGWGRTAPLAATDSGQSRPPVHTSCHIATCHLPCAMSPATDKVPSESRRIYSLFPLSFFYVSTSLFSVFLSSPFRLYLSLSLPSFSLPFLMSRSFCFTIFFHACLPLLSFFMSLLPFYILKNVSLYTALLPLFSVFYCFCIL